ILALIWDLLPQAEPGDVPPLCDRLYPLVSNAVLFPGRMRPPKPWSERGEHATGKRKQRCAILPYCTKAHAMTVWALRTRWLLVLLAATVTSPTRADIDHLVPQDESGIWNPSIYRGLQLGLNIGQIGLALYEGGETRLGNTAWRGIDSELIAAVSTEAFKRTFRRARPRDNPDPDSWFPCGSNSSFLTAEPAHPPPPV